MAIRVDHGAMGRGRGRYQGPGTLSEMNIVPLVDVVLVLLIIFMITAQAMEFGLEIEVPKVNRTQSTVKEMPVLSISRAGEMRLNERPLSNINLLEQEMNARFPGQKAIYVRCDKNVVMDVFMKVANAAQKAKLQVSVVAANE